MTDRPGFHVQPLMLSEHGLLLTTAGSDLDAAVTQLQQGMAYNMMGPGNEIPPWGTDSVGREFGGAFTDTVRTVWPSVASYQRQIQLGARVLFDAGQSFQRLDLGGAYNLSRVFDGRPR